MCQVGSDLHPSIVLRKASRRDLGARRKRGVAKEAQLVFAKMEIPNDEL